MTLLQTSRPLKLLYVVYFVAKTIVKVPIWTLVSLFPSLRPKPSWSIEKCLRIYFIRSLLRLQLKLAYATKRDLTKEVPNSTLRNARFVWVEGVDDRVLMGELKMFVARTGVKPAKIPGYWQFRKGHAGDWTPKAKEGEKVVYHLHGGAFWVGTAHPADLTAMIPRGILEHSQTISRTFALDYRLSTSAPHKPENPFPAALLDALAGYHYLIEMGFRAENIVLAGDSAGGNLAIALVRHLIENATGVEKPGKLLLLSPWGDLSFSLVGPNSSRILNDKSDMFPAEHRGEGSFGEYGVVSYLGTELKREEAKTNKYISPASPHVEVGEQGLFKGFPKTYISAGGAEMLLDDSKVIAKRIEVDNAGRSDWVKLDIVKDAVHDFLIFPWNKPERPMALSRISKWIDEE